MDRRRFDSLTRSLASTKSRRGLLSSLAAFGAGLLDAKAASATIAPCPIPEQIRNRKGDCSCPPGTDLCPTGCVDKKRDLANCGACGRSCAGGECRKGECRCPDGRQPSPEFGCDDPLTCVGITPGTAECSTNDDCASGQDCINGGCFTACDESNPGSCSAGDACTDCDCSSELRPTGSYCQDNNFGIGICQNNSDCPAGSLCSLLPAGGDNYLCVRPCPTL